MTEELAVRLERLDAAARPAAERFDAGGPLGRTAAVLPSAFNPPTHAHQHLLERALETFGISSAIALLTTRNVDKGLHGAPLADRVGMLLALGEAFPGLAVMAANQARIIDQAVALALLLPGVELDFVVGFDTLERLFAPLANVIGWHSDFELGRILGVRSLEVTRTMPMPPFGIFTFLIQRKAEAARAAA